MDINMGKSNWLFLFTCLLLGIVAEESFFQSEIGISYLVFIVAFYSVFFWKYRRFLFTHQRMGYLVLTCIWLLSASFFINQNMLFYVLNLLVIPTLVIFHIVLVTSPKMLSWNRVQFIFYVFSRIIEAIKYNVMFASLIRKLLKKRENDSNYLIGKKIVIGIVLSVPVLLVVLKLLMSADAQFEQLIGWIPYWLQNVNGRDIIRIIAILIYTLFFFGMMQILYRKHTKAVKLHPVNYTFQADGIIALTVLVIMNVVYVIFTFVQFKYFFGGTLMDEFTYAQYARKGFFELLFVTLINLSLTIVVLSFVHKTTKVLNRLIQSMLTILVLSSGVILCSAFSRLSLYENAYGFTFTRVLSHSFMIYLVLILTYTLVKIWMENLSLLHFYIITTLIFYSVINIVDLNHIVVKKNINRYEQTGKIDVEYLNQLSYTGVLGLISLYERDRNIPGLETILRERKNETLTENDSWQSYNLKKVQVQAKLKKIDLE